MARLNGVAAHVAVVLLRDPVARAQRGGRDELQPRISDIRRLIDVHRFLHPVLPLRALPRALVDRCFIRDGRRRGIENDLAVVLDDQTVVFCGDFADLCAVDVPLGADFLEFLDVFRSHDSAHALLGLGGEDLRGGHILRAQRDGVEVDAHATVAGCRQLGRRARQTRAAEVLDADDDIGAVELQAALDEDLLRERVADLNCGQLALRALLEGLGRQDRHAADAVKTRAGTEEHDLIARAGSECELQVLDLQRAHAQRVDQWVTRVGGIKRGLAADIRQTERVAVATDARDDARQDALGVVRVSRTEAQLVHHGDRARAHGHDVADNAADTGRRTLVRLHVGGVVVRLDAERHRVAAADVHHAGILADAGENLRGHLLSHGLAEIAQVHLGRLVGAVLRPHHRVDRQLRIRRTAAQNLADAGILVVLEAQRGIRLFLLRRRLRGLDGVVVHERVLFLFAHANHAPIFEISAMADWISPRPSVDGPVSRSMACSGCGISPTTRRFSLVTPAMPFMEPLKLSV